MAQKTGLDEVLIEAIRVLDRDGGGYVTAADARRFFGNLGDFIDGPQLQCVVARLNGKLTAEKVEVLVQDADLFGDRQTLSYDLMVKMLVDACDANGPSE